MYINHVLLNQNALYAKMYRLAAVLHISKKDYKK